MSLRHLVFIALVTLVGVGCSSTPPPSPENPAALIVVERGGKFELSVPASRLVLQLPAAGFVRDERLPVENPRYFLFQDKARGLIVSGWFEPAHRFERVRNSWADKFRPSDKPGDPRPDVELSKIGEWDTGSFAVTVGGTSNTHLTAHLVQADTWVELHLSALSALTPAEQRASLAELLRSIVVLRRPRRSGVV